MFAPESVLVTLFWSCVSLVIAAYVGYPAVIAMLARLFGKRRPAPASPPEDELPTVSILISAYNEQDVILARLRNALDLDYPANSLEILVGTDGCTDATAALVRALGAENVRLFEFVANRGKSAVLNELAEAARGEILLMTDANTMFDPATARRLARWFAEPAVGVACGRLVLIDGRGGRNADGCYWKYETFLKRREARLGVVLGANGAVYAIRKRSFRPIPVDTLIDDFVIPLRIRLRDGCRCVYDDEAVAYEETAPDLTAEFHRRARIGAGGFQAIGRLSGLLDPRQGWFALAFLGHKILRWLCPFFLIGALATCLLLVHRRPYLELMLMQMLGYTSVAIRPITGRRPPLPFRLSAMFVGMNAALLVGFWRWLRGRQAANWRRTKRSVDVPATVAGITARNRRPARRISLQQHRR